MNNFSIYCTDEQTQNAYKLGAPLNEFSGYLPTISIDGILYDKPTVEQMIGWLETQEIYFSITCIGDYVYEVWYKDECGNGVTLINDCAPTRSDANIFAIDSALQRLQYLKRFI